MENNEINLIGRELPHSREAELSVIGSVLTEQDSVAASAEIIKPSDFYFEAHKLIYQAVMDLFNENIPIDFVTVSDRLRQEDKLDNIGGISYLSQAAVSVPTTENVVYYSKIIREKSILRKLITAASGIEQLAYSEAGASETILERAEQAIFGVSQDNEQNDIVPIGDALMGVYTEMVEHAENRGKLTGLDTGYAELNRRTGGFKGGELIIIGGRPGMGKSSFAVNIAEHVAIQNNSTVALFNLEMPRNQIITRILCSQAYVDSNKIRMGSMGGEDWIQIGDVVDRIALAPLYIDDSAAITVSEIRAKCRRLKQTKGLSLIVIDYLQLMQNGRSENRQQEISDISRSLKILAKELDVPVIALSQLARASESGADKRPLLSHLRESGSIEQDADMVLFLYRDEYYNPDSEDKNLAECIVAKNRSGETGMFKLGWQGKYTKFLNVEIKTVEE